MTGLQLAEQQSLRRRPHRRRGPRLLVPLVACGPVATLAVVCIAYLLWPSLEPPDPNPKPPALAQGTVPAPAALERVFVSIAAGGASVPPAERVLTIYPRYTISEASPGPGGLTVLAFRDGTPYQGEDLIYDAEAPGFLVRCTRRAGAIPGTCLYEQWIETVKLVFRFPRDWLDDWRFVASNVERLIAALRPARS